MNAMKRHTLMILAAVLAACIIIVGMTCPVALAAEQQAARERQALQLFSRMENRM